MIDSQRTYFKEIFKESIQMSYNRALLLRKDWFMLREDSKDRGES